MQIGLVVPWILHTSSIVFIFDLEFHSTNTIIEASSNSRRLQPKIRGEGGGGGQLRDKLDLMLDKTTNFGYSPVTPNKAFQ